MTPEEQKAVGVLMIEHGEWAEFHERKRKVHANDNLRFYHQEMKDYHNGQYIRMCNIYHGRAPYTER